MCYGTSLWTTKTIDIRGQGKQTYCFVNLLQRTTGLRLRRPQRRSNEFSNTKESNHCNSLSLFPSLLHVHFFVVFRQNNFTQHLRRLYVSFFCAVAATFFTRMSCNKSFPTNFKSIRFTLFAHKTHLCIYPRTQTQSTAII